MRCVIPCVLAVALAVPLRGQDETDPRAAAVGELIEQYQDLWASDLERAEAGDRLVAFGGPAAGALVAAALEDARDRHGWRLFALLERMRGDAAPAVPALLAAAGPEEEPFVRHSALRTLGTIGPYVAGFDPGAIADPAAGAAGDVRPGLHEVWCRLQARCGVARDAPLDELIEVIASSSVDLDEADMVVEVIADRGARAAAALPHLRELRDLALQGYRTLDGFASIDLALCGRVAGAVVRLAPVDESSLPDYREALAGGASYLVPEEDRLLALHRLADLGGRHALEHAQRVLRTWPSERLALGALDALRRLGPTAVDALPQVEEIAASADRDDRIRDAARRAVGAIRGDGR